MKYKLKICGMRYADNVREVAALKPDYMGFIFYEKSKRFIGKNFNPAIIDSLPKETTPVGVFVNPSLDDIYEAYDKGFMTVQLHGDESPDFCSELDAAACISSIKAFRIDENFDFKILKPYKSVCPYFLFDTQTEGYGGSGRKFNWRLLEKYDNEVPFFLSGGISLEDAEEINKLEGLNIHAIDINSRFELNPGMKDVAKIKNFMESLN
jgi:phosphoribosylanthranilate isomerase